MADQGCFQQALILASQIKQVVYTDFSAWVVQLDLAGRQSIFDKPSSQWKGFYSMPSITIQQAEWIIAHFNASFQTYKLAVAGKA